MAYAVAVDIGGTFTDLVAFDHETQKVIYAKSPTTYDNLVEGILDCFEKAKVIPGESNLVNHGTTLVINSFIQRRGAIDPELSHISDVIRLIFTISAMNP